MQHAAAPNEYLKQTISIWLVGQVCVNVCVCERDGTLGGIELAIRLDIKLTYFVNNHNFCLYARVSVQMSMCVWEYLHLCGLVCMPMCVCVEPS